MNYNIVMTQSLSVKCKLIVPVEFQPKIDETLRGFADACNQILEIARRENCWNTTKLHHKVYKPVREATGLKANHVCQAIRRVIGNAKAVKQIHKFRPTSISLDVRTFKYVEETQTVGVTLKCGRVDFKLSIGGYQIALLRNQTLTSATLNKSNKGDYYINFVVEIDTPPTGKTPKVIGVDLGRRDIATTSTGKSWSGEQIQSVRDRFSRVRANPVVFVPPAYTSQTCSRCRHIHPEKGKSYRNGKKFKCGYCGFEHDADINAAINIADLGGAVSLPESPGIACLLEGQLPLFRLV
jgi:hypothetical protein